MFTSETHEGEVIGKFFGDDLYHESLSPEGYACQLDKHGFDIVDYIENNPSCEITIWLARLR
ncbi:hypothetical protein [Klebsiella oxytoca]|uniref:hypothetical protein n=1 Tax=Klebsiella oxytoca TaxID=571 RepID=UPI0035717624